MSQMSQFALESKHFKNDARPKQGYQKPDLNVHNSIVEEEEDRVESRARTRQNKEPRDQLDRLMESRQKGWGEMSSVNSEITKEIE